MMADSLDTSRADHVYRIGPETLAAESYAIYAGPVARYSKQVSETSEPGPSGFALRWVVSGRLESPEVVKGPPPASPALPFMRAEQSGMLPQPLGVAAWERELGDLQATDHALLFFRGDRAKPQLKVLPDRGADSGPAALVRRAVVIQGLADPAERLAAWLAFLPSAPTDEGRRAALRALLASGAGWPQFEAALAALLARPDLSLDLRTFGAGIVAFGVMQNRWGTQQADAVDFVCRQFENARDPWLSLQQLLILKQLLAHAADAPLRERILQALKQRAAAAALPPELEAQYQQLREAYPGQL